MKLLLNFRIVFIQCPISEHSLKEDIERYLFPDFLCRNFLIQDAIGNYLFWFLRIKTSKKFLKFWVHFHFIEIILINLWENEYSLFWKNFQWICCIESKGSIFMKHMFISVNHIVSNKYILIYSLYKCTSNACCVVNHDFIVQPSCPWKFMCTIIT